MTFIDFARIHGVEIDPNRLFASDRIKRCGTVDKPKSDNGAYFWDGRRGWVQNWANGDTVIWYQDGDTKPWTDEEKRAWAAKKRSAEDSQERKYQMTAQKADMILRTAVLQKHNYLHLKGFPDLKGMVLDGRLLIPMRNVMTNDLQGYQQIWWDEEERKYHKKMLPGMRAKHAVLWMGTRDAPEIWLVEGYATGWSLHHALRSTGSAASVVVCFSASNLVQVAPMIKGKRFVFADNDPSKKHPYTGAEVGMAGERAAIQTGLPWTMANEVGWDANDLHTKNSLWAVVQKIMEVRRKVV